MQIQARDYRTGHLANVSMADGTITAIRSISGTSSNSSSLWIAPALFDIQINGGLGIGFSATELTEEDVRRVVEACHRHGLAGFCPTLITNSFEALEHGFHTLSRCCSQDRSLARAMPFFHLEGPYISAEDGPRGAHPRRHVRAPDWEEFCRLQHAAQGRIRLVTLAPEHEGAPAFIERLVASGVVVSIGHTAAKGTQIRDAIRAGARLSTHLGNGSHATLPRHENYIWEQLAADELWASIIPDGHHLPPSVVRCMLRVKTPARTILISDASSLAGMPPGVYKAWEQELEILPEGKIVVRNSGFLAGSWDFTDTCVGKILQMADVPLPEAIEMAGARPRALLSLPKVELEPGSPADLILFHWKPGSDFQVCATVVAGELIYRDLSFASAEMVRPGG